MPGARTCAGDAMKVCVVGTRGFPLITGGVEKHCELLYPVVSQQAEVTVFRRKPYVKEGGAYRNITFRDLPSTRIKGLEAVLHSFLATLCAIWQRPDVIHYHNIGPALFSPLARLAGIPVVLTYHSPNYEHDKWGRFAKALLRFSEKVAMKTAARIIFVNRFQMERFPPEVQAKCEYIPNGVESPVHTDRTDFLEKIGVEPGKYLLSVGRITQEKGFDTLLRAFSQAELPGCSLVIAGGVDHENGYMQTLRELAQGSPVVFPGHTYGEELAQLYRNAALYVLPSNNEGFPMVLLEAASYGLDVAVSDIPATHLMALEEADFFQKGDPRDCARVLERKLRNPRKRTYDLREFDWQTIGRRVVDVYKEGMKA